MEPLSTQIAQFSSRLFDRDDIDYTTFSPYVPLSLYQAGVVQLRLLKQTGGEASEDELNSLKRILERFRQRWASAGDFLPRHIYREAFR